MKESYICGFIVLRNPIFNYGKNDQGIYLEIPPGGEKIYYNGIDRMPWFDLDEYYYSGQLPVDLIEIRNAIESSDTDFSDISLLQDIRQAYLVYSFLNSRTQNKNELAVVYSKELAEKRGFQTVDMEIKWLGIDIYCPGYGSQIREGIFNMSKVFTKYLRYINEYGLFSDEYICDKYIDCYLQLSHLYDLESVPGELVNRVQKIRLGTIKCLNQSA